MYRYYASSEELKLFSVFWLYREENILVGYAEMQFSGSALSHQRQVCATPIPLFSACSGPHVEEDCSLKQLSMSL